MPLNLEEFQREQFQAYVENVEPSRQYRLARFMPFDETYDMEFTYNIINGGYGQMASITALDSGAPLRDKEVLARMTAELGKVQHSYRITEKEMLHFYRPRTDAEKQKVIDAIYNQTDRLVDGVYDRAEWFRSRAVYHGGLQYTENGVDLDIDFMIPQENKLTADVMGDGTFNADADILGALRTAVKRFKDANNGQSPAVMHFNGTVETYFLTSSQIKAQIWGNGSDPRIVTGEQLGTLFNALSLPAYEVIDDTVIGDEGVETLIPDDRIVFIGNDLGEVMQGPTVENDYEPGIYVVPEVQKTNPPKEQVFVGATMFPALKRPNAVVHLDLV